MLTIFVGTYLFVGDSKIINYKTLRQFANELSDRSHKIINTLLLLSSIEKENFEIQSIPTSRQNRSERNA